MLEKPALPDERLCACLKDDFGLAVEALSFLPLGADVDTAVYRAQSNDGARYFVKLRRGAFEPNTLLVPQLLGRRGVPAVIPPCATISGALWSRLDEFTVLVSPFVGGRDGYERELTDEQWIMLGRFLRALHELNAGEVLGRLVGERYSPRHRERVRGFLSQAELDEPIDFVAAQVRELLHDRREVVLALLERADELATTLEARKLPQVVCHGDFHAGNVLVGDNGSLYVVDWDTLLLAPRERDLMAIGMGGVWPGGRQAELFYRGYGPIEVDTQAIAYFRCERIVQDIAAFCAELLLSDSGGSDRAQSLRYLAANFEPSGLIDVALAS